MVFFRRVFLEHLISIGSQVTCTSCWGRSFSFSSRAQSVSVFLLNSKVSDLRLWSNLAITRISNIVQNCSEVYLSQNKWMRVEVVIRSFIKWGPIQLNRLSQAARLECLPLQHVYMHIRTLIFQLRYLTKTKILSMLGTGYLAGNLTSARLLGVFNRWVHYSLPERNPKLRRTTTCNEC